MYKPIYDKASRFKKIGEIATWVFLLFLIPSTALGYFAEQSLPGQPLFPAKLGIEKVVLELQSFNPQAQASYQVDLVNKRFDEIQTLLTKDTTNADDLTNFGVQLQQATQYVNSLPPSQEKTALQQKLASNIQTYQQQIRVQQQIFQNKSQINNMQNNAQVNFGAGGQGIPNLRLPTLPPSPTPTLIPNNGLTTVHFNTPTPYPSFTPSPTPTSNTQDNSSIDAALQDMQNQLSTASYDLSQNTFYFVSPTPTIQPSGTPTPTITPSPTPTTTPTPTITPSPYPSPTYVPYPTGWHPYYTPTPTPKQSYKNGG